MSFTGEEAEEFSLTTAAEWTANYRSANPDGRNAHFFGKVILERILAQTGCVGIRVYYALDSDGKQQMIMVGADANENDLHNGIVAEVSRPCPPYCPSGSPLMEI